MNNRQKQPWRMPNSSSKTVRPNWNSRSRSTKNGRAKNAPPAVWRKPVIARKPPPNAFNVVKMAGKLPKSGSIRHPTLYQQQMAQLTGLYQRLKRFEQDNAANLHPVQADFRLNAGFGTYDNVALLIEYGYEVYTKPHSHRVVAFLKKLSGEQAAWTRVGA